jgi:hypothetical protein
VSDEVRDYGDYPEGHDQEDAEWDGWEDPNGAIVPGSLSEADALFEWDDDDVCPVCFGSGLILEGRGECPNCMGSGVTS